MCLDLYEDRTEKEKENQRSSALHGARGTKKRMALKGPGRTFLRALRGRSLFFSPPVPSLFPSSSSTLYALALPSTTHTKAAAGAAPAEPSTATPAAAESSPAGSGGAPPSSPWPRRPRAPEEAAAAARPAAAPRPPPAAGSLHARLRRMAAEDHPYMYGEHSLAARFASRDPRGRGGEEEGHGEGGGGGGH